MESILLWALLGLNLVLIVLVCLLLLKNRGDMGGELSRHIEEGRREDAEERRRTRTELTQTIQSSVSGLGEMLSASQSQSARYQSQLIEEMGKALLQRQDAVQHTVSTQLAQSEERFRSFSQENEQKLEAIRQTVERRLAYIQQDNAQQLGEMRRVVDEKLQKTLEERMTRSFQAVSERLEQVYKGLGEMQNLANGVGDLKKVLSNVKTRGILGEIQLGAILEEILAPEQYAYNVAVTPGSKNVVEYAVRLPAEDGSVIWLPIDSKFPAEAYADLRDAYDSGSPEAVSAAWSVLQSRIRSFAKDIRDKYISPPDTTEFGIMFLPFEGLYAEVVNRGMVEVLQREYHVNIAGPSTMAALLNSLQMGFRAFAIQKRSGEVWKVLGAVKSEFDKFASVLAATQQRLEQAGNELDKLVGVRTRQIQKRLKDVASLNEAQLQELLPADAEVLDPAEEGAVTKLSPAEDPAHADLP